MLQWVISLLDLLEFLHMREEPVVYNDVKPENMILKEDGTIRVIDYGIAKIPDRYENLSPMGTPGYASPEHISGKTDARSDIFSVGITLYALLTGKNCFLNYYFYTYFILSYGVSLDEDVYTMRIRFVDFNVMK